VCPERTDKGQMGSGRFFDRFFEKKKASFLEENHSLGAIRGFLSMLLELMVEGVNIFNYYPPVPALMKKQTSLLPHWMLLN